jgi:hypothetical protein
MVSDCVIQQVSWDFLNWKIESCRCVPQAENGASRARLAEGDSNWFGQLLQKG